MPLEPGKILGPYEIRALIGAGGMGEVYRARDTRLSRDVALKILPVSVVTEPERQRRFRLEALAAGALNHPNIVAIYDVNLDGDMPYIVLELVDGQPLHRVLAGKPMAVRKLLDAAVQIADGMAAAHRAGIIHRDLKPDNILLTRDHRVKILDFGLAKSIGVPGAPENPKDSTMTVTGAVLGTVNYMSPEQASGRELDLRSDIFSFGLILYEMATGQRPFARKTAVQTMAAIISEDPPPITTPIPNTLRFTIDRCLVKDPSLRYASSLDLFESLRHQRDGLNESQVTLESRTGSLMRPALRRWRLRLKPYFLPAACLAAGAAAMGLMADPAGPASASFRYSPLATGPEAEDRAAWSPDGERIAYHATTNGVRQIFTRSLNAPSAVMATHGPDNSEFPEWSGDGARVFFQRRGSVYAVGAGGGEPQKIVENVDIFGVSPDGKVLAFLRKQADPQSFSVWISSPPGAAPVRYPAGAHEAPDYATGTRLVFSPDGRKILFWALMKEPGRGSEFWILPFPPSQPRRVLPSLVAAYPMRGFTWLKDSRRIVMAATIPPEVYRSHLYIADTQTDTYQLLVGGIGSEAFPALSPDGGRLAYTAMEYDHDIVEFGLDGSPMRSLVATHRMEHAPAWSPVNEEFAYVTDRTGVDEIWIRTPERSRDQPVVTPAVFKEGGVKFLTSPAFSPDGERLAFMRHGDPKAATARDITEIWTIPVSGGAPLRLTNVKGSQWAPTWSRDGGWIAFYSEGPPAGLMKARLGSDGRAEMLHATSGYCTYCTPDWSPVDDVIAFHDADATLLISADGKSKKVLRKPALRASAWSRDGKTLYGFAEAAGQQSIVALTVATGAEKTVTMVSPGVRIRTVWNPTLRLSLSRDGKSLATSVGIVSGDLWQLENFQSAVPWWRQWFAFSR